MVVDIVSKATVGGSEDYVCPVEDNIMSSTWKDKGTEKPKRGGGGILKAKADTEMNTEENILQIYREKQRLLMEANTEKDIRLERLEKEFNDHTIQHNEGIHWLRLQLDTSRLEKNAADERIAELQKELRRTSSDQPPRNISLNTPTISDSVGKGEEKDNLIIRLQSRAEKYESSFEVMEKQMAMIKSSSGEVIKTLKEEIADLMEGRTRVELDLLNQLSELDNENRRRQLEYALELHNKDETIETLRNLDNCSISAKGQQASSLSTLIYNGSSSTEDTCEIWPSDQADDLPTDEQRGGKEESSLVLRLGDEKAELQRKLHKANKELEDFRSGLNVKDNLELVRRVSEERRAIDMSLDRVKTVFGSTDAAVSNLKGIIEKFKTDDDSGAEREKKRMLSVLESASLIHEEVKLSILLTELKLRNEFECLKKNHMMNEGNHQATPDKQELINDFKEIQNNALIELGKAGAEFSRQFKDLERRTILEKTKIEDFLQKSAQKSSQKRDRKHASKSSKTSQTLSMHELLLAFQADRDSRDSSAATDDSLMINRDVLHLLEKELLELRERMLAKNQKIMLLKEGLERHKIRESDLRKELRALIKSNVSKNRSGTTTAKDTSNKSFKVVNDTSKTNEDERRNSMLSQNIPREIHTTRVVSPESILSDQNVLSAKFEGEISRRRKGMSDDSLEGGTNPIAPIHPLTPGNRRDSIGFVPSPPSAGKKINSKSTSTTNSTKDAIRRLQPTSREIKKLVFLPPCFFSDLE
jgi:hypothetical protein